MSSDLQRLRRAVIVIARLAWKYRQEDVAKALMKHCTERERGNVPFVGQYLLDVWECYKPEEDAMEPRCCECGGNIIDAKDNEHCKRGALSSDFIVRADARYCSAKCRQRAYRKRVTSGRPRGRVKRNAEAVRDASHDAQNGLGVTP